MSCPNCERENIQKSIIIETHQSSINQLNQETEYNICKDCNHKWKNSEEES